MSLFTTQLIPNGNEGLWMPFIDAFTFFYHIFCWFQCVNWENEHAWSSTCSFAALIQCEFTNTKCLHETCELENDRQFSLTDPFLLSLWLENIVFTDSLFGSLFRHRLFGHNWKELKFKQSIVDVARIAQVKWMLIWISWRPVSESLYYSNQKLCD